MFWPVRWFFSSAVATGMPLRNRQRSTRLVGVRVERELARDGQPVGVVVGDQLGRDAERGLAIREADLDVLVADAVTEDIDRAALVDLLRKPLDEPLARELLVAAVGLDELAPTPGLASAR